MQNSLESKSKTFPGGFVSEAILWITTARKLKILKQQLATSGLIECSVYQWYAIPSIAYHREYLIATQQERNTK